VDDFLNRVGRMGQDRRLAFFVGGESVPELIELMDSS